MYTKIGIKQSWHAFFWPNIVFSACHVKMLQISDKRSETTPFPNLSSGVITELLKTYCSNHFLSKDSSQEVEANSIAKMRYAA